MFTTFDPRHHYNIVQSMTTASQEPCVTRSLLLIQVNCHLVDSNHIMAHVPMFAYSLAMIVILLTNLASWTLSCTVAAGLHG